MLVRPRVFIAVMNSSEGVRQALRSYDFKALMIEHLGWDHAQGELTVKAAGYEYRLDAVAQKRGVVVYVCQPGPAGGIPDAAHRALIDEKSERPPTNTSLSSSTVTIKTRSGIGFVALLDNLLRVARIATTSRSLAMLSFRSSTPSPSPSKRRPR